jgi:glycosyltransferase involved in cell wall biosynthesis
MKLSIIVPIFNEEKTLGLALRRIMEAPCPLEKELILVDDCSTDRSPEILSAFSGLANVALIKSSSNMGKGQAIKSGLEHVTGDLVMIHDADLEYDPQEIPSLLNPILSGEADIVYGSRFLRGGGGVSLHSFANKFLTALSNVLSGMRLTDMETCYKVFPTELVRAMDLRSRRFGIEIELTAYAAKSGLRIVECPISYQPRSRDEGKKIGWRDGVAAIFHLFRFNLFTSSQRAFRRKM